MTRTIPRLLAGLACLAVLSSIAAKAQEPRRAEANSGQFFPITQPITTDEVEQIQAAAGPMFRQGAGPGDRRNVLIFEIRPGKSPFGAAFDLADYLSTKPGTVAYVPEPITGYAALVALACDEIVMGTNASIGPITPEGEDVKSAARDAVRTFAKRKGRDPNLLLGMLDKDAPLRHVKTADGKYAYLMESEISEYEKNHRVVENEAAWDAGGRGVLTASRARSEGIIELIADDRAEIGQAYNLAGINDDPTRGQARNPVWIKIEGQLDSVKESYLKRRIAQAEAEKVNLVFFEIDSPGGLDQPADNIADMISRIKDMKTVAYVSDQAMGVAALLPLACNDIVFHKGARMGDVSRLMTDRRFERLEEGQARALAEKAQALAKKNGHSEALARAMVDPNAEVIEARDVKTGNVRYVLQSQVQAEPDRFVPQGTIKKADGAVLTLTAEDAVRYGLAREVVKDREDFQAIYGLRGQSIRVDGPTWVDAVVTTLNTQWMSGLLLFIGFFMLIVEIKLPGIGLPAIIAVLAFLLFFWSHYLSGTADQLEIMLFLAGLICLALELFVFPGFGVFGMSGILLILVSVVMASHTFVWPTRDYEYRQMGQTLMQVVVSIIAVGAGAILLGRYFPSLPLFNRIVLKPEPAQGVALDQDGKPVLDADAPLSFLIGETGRTTTTLRPSGKARIGELLVDVIADGFYIDPDTLVEVVEVQGSRVVVKRV